MVDNTGGPEDIAIKANDFEVSELVNDDVVDHLRGQLHDTPMKVERPICAARSPSEPKIHDIDEPGRCNAEYGLPSRHSVIQIGVCRACVIFGNPLLTCVHLLTTEKQSIPFKTNR